MRNYNDLSQNPQLGSLAERWKQFRDKPVSTLLELVHCYYTDIMVVCIPHHKIAPGQLVLKQYKSLYKEITEATKRTRVVRANSGHCGTGMTWGDILTTFLIISRKTLPMYLSTSWMQHLCTTQFIPTFTFISKEQEFV
ncbi:hypothetical protein BDZ91DRAFT_509829 [Kalaharituber pfeilii]|nr:hypothetical protein BDZ91DRAFT_509829 [Kalaharituber pfeilii]